MLEREVYNEERFLLKKLNGRRINDWFQAHYLLIAVLLLGLFLRIINLNTGLWLDELFFFDYCNVSKNSLFTNVSEWVNSSNWDIYKIILPYIKSLDLPEWSVRLPSYLASIWAMCIFYAFGRSIKDKWLGLSFALVYAVNPLAIYYAQEARGYQIYFTVNLLSCYLFYLILKSKELNKKTCVFYFVSLFYGTMLRPEGRLLLFGHCCLMILFLLFTEKNKLTKARNVFRLIILCACVYGIFRLNENLVLLKSFLSSAGGAYGYGVKNIDTSIPVMDSILHYVRLLFDIPIKQNPLLFPEIKALLFLLTVSFIGIFINIKKVFLPFFVTLFSFFYFFATFKYVLPQRYFYSSFILLYFFLGLGVYTLSSSIYFFFAKIIKKGRKYYSPVLFIGVCFLSLWYLSVSRGFYDFEHYQNYKKSAYSCVDKYLKQHCSKRKILIYDVLDQTSHYVMKYYYSALENLEVFHHDSESVLTEILKKNASKEHAFLLLNWKFRLIDDPMKKAVLENYEPVQLYWKRLILKNKNLLVRDKPLSLYLNEHSKELFFANSMSYTVYSKELLDFVVDGENYSTDSKGCSVRLEQGFHDFALPESSEKAKLVAITPELKMKNFEKALFRYSQDGIDAVEIYARNKEVNSRFRILPEKKHIIIDLSSILKKQHLKGKRVNVALSFFAPENNPIEIRLCDSRGYSSVSTTTSKSFQVANISHFINRWDIWGQYLYLDITGDFKYLDMQELVVYPGTPQIYSGQLDYGEIKYTNNLGASLINSKLAYLYNQGKLSEELDLIVEDHLKNSFYKTETLVYYANMLYFRYKNPEKAIGFIEKNLARVDESDRIAWLYKTLVYYSKKEGLKEKESFYDRLLKKRKAQ